MKNRFTTPRAAATMAALGMAALSVTPANAARFLGNISNYGDFSQVAYDNQEQCESEASYGESCVKFHDNCGGYPLWAYEAIVNEWANYVRDGETLSLIVFEDVDGDGIYDYGANVCSLAL